MAVNKSHQRQGFGETLLIDAIKNAINSSGLVPKPMIIVEAKNEIARNIYKDMGFTEFPQNPNKLFMPQKEAEHMLEESGVL
ncbi:GNAT family N-acetyltransferase [Photobacterium sanguinicancri]|uniref:GNAT family N-acetyltransferase n=1 Tax=Photobacterium sanguinicancri TaxID=875932 RepID=UPI001F14D7E1|nr:GNAT family N-acetyltransferase [Photobacterium sanguinicancri]